MNSSAFIHAVNPRSKLAAVACLNLVRTGTLWSPDYLVSKDPALQAGTIALKLLPTRVLREAPFPPGALSPAALFLSIAANSKSGAHLHYGDGQPLAEELIEYSLKRAEKELGFEEVRRQICPEAPSRLSCLWLAENSEAGREMLKTIFRSSKLHFLTVRVVESVASHKGDWKHWEEFWKHGSQQAAEAYWLSKPSGTGPFWEYLLDGLIECAEELEVAQLCKAHLESNCGPWTDQNPPPKELVEAARLPFK